MKGYYYYTRRRRPAPKIEVQKHDWSMMMRVILDAGITLKNIYHATGAGSRMFDSIRKGVTEPSHPIGEYILAVYNVIITGGMPRHTSD